jgi:hypothetical protein
MAIIFNWSARCNAERGSKLPKAKKPSGAFIFSNGIDLLPTMDLNYSGRMKTFRILLGVLAVIPLALLIKILFFYPALNCDSCIGTYAYMLFGVPILTLNFWAWTSPEIIEFYFFGIENSNKN